MSPKRKTQNISKPRKLEGGAPADTVISWSQMIGARGYQLRTTLRQYPGESLWDHIEEVISLLTSIDALGDQDALTPGPKPKAPRTAEPTKEDIERAERIRAQVRVPEPQRIPVGLEGAPSFLVTSTEVRIERGKTLLKVRGGEWTAFGVNVWPEVAIEAGIVQTEEEYNSLDPRNPPDLRGWIALYTFRDSQDGNTVPHKVVGLRKYKQEGLL